MGQSDARVLEALARALARRPDAFKPQELANAAWAFASVGKTDVQVLEASARVAERRLGEFQTLDLANMA